MSGLIDKDDTADATAERELLEETGYVGKAIKTSMLLYNDPGLSNANMKTVTVKVDMTLPQNQIPVSQQEEGEQIETFTVALKNLYDKLQELEQMGCRIDARLANFALGINVARQYKLDR